MDIMMQLYDQEEIMKIRDKRIERDSGIMNVVIVLKEMGLTFIEIVNKVKKQFNLSQEVAEREVKEYWKE